MFSIHEDVNTRQEAQDTQKVEICALGHELGDCPARRAGCRNHYQLLHFLMPPLPVLHHVRATMAGDPTVRRWLDNLDAVLPGGRREQGGW